MAICRPSIYRDQAPPFTPTTDASSPQSPVHHVPLHCHQKGAPIRLCIITSQRAKSLLTYQRQTRSKAANVLSPESHARMRGPPKLWRCVPREEVLESMLREGGRLSLCDAMMLSTQQRLV
eukprot:6448080-Amphidinium_carterae.2